MAMGKDPPEVDPPKLPRIIDPEDAHSTEASSPATAQPASNPNSEKGEGPKVEVVAEQDEPKSSRVVGGEANGDASVKSKR